LRPAGIRASAEPRSSTSASSAPGILRPSSLRWVRERTSSTIGASPRCIISFSSVTPMRAARSDLRNCRRTTQRYAT
jgi:hypothetical protein